MSRIALLLFALHAAASGKDLRIGVFGLFHPSELVLRAVPGGAVRVDVAGAVWNLEGSRTARFRVGRSGVLCTAGDRAGSAAVVRASGERGKTEFLLSVPGKIERRFMASLEVRVRGGELVPIVVTDLETAVASAVAAESLPGAPRRSAPGPGHRHPVFLPRLSPAPSRFPILRYHPLPIPQRTARGICSCCRGCCRDQGRGSAPRRRCIGGAVFSQLRRADANSRRGGHGRRKLSLLLD